MMAPGKAQSGHRLRRGLCAVGGWLCLLLGSVVPLAQAQLSTEDHLGEPGFWPTREQPSVQLFAAQGSCARCHAGIAALQRQSAMAQTLVPAADSGQLHRSAQLSFHFGGDVYGIHSSHAGQGWMSLYTVEDGAAKLAYPLLWSFGTGRVGQSYLFKKEDGHVYEARVTYLESRKDLGFTPARALQGPTDLVTAMGREVPMPELMRCFSCHATAVSIAGALNEAGLRPGVGCEACHGPGAAHVERMSSPQRAAAAGKYGAIFEPAHLSPTESVEFCGACHGSWWDVKLAGVTGPSTVRSAPYRLVTSRCWGKQGDPRLVCTACHDPHRDLVTDIAQYDRACLRCHAGSHAGTANMAPADRAFAPACPVATAKCASCHMPQVYVPEMQNTFTDHRIRVVKQGEPFRD